MAGGGAKKRLDENQKRLQLLRTTVLVSSLTFLAARLLLFKASTSWVHWLGFAATLLVDLLAYLLIASLAKPVYDATTGELRDGGADLNKHATASYAHDVLYITCLVQATAAFTRYGWLLYLAIPAYAAYVLFTSVIYPYVLAPKKEQQAVDPELLKRLDKAERRSERRRMKRF